MGHRSSVTGCHTGHVGTAETGIAPNRGINFPRLYDLLLLLLARDSDRNYRKDLIKLAGVAPGDSALDIGCGTGTQAIETYRQSQPGGSVAGVDISMKMRAAARCKARRAGVNIDFRWADATALPFENDRFDIATITTVMHMIPGGRRRLCLREALRVLKRGGRLLLIDYAGDLGDRRGWIARLGPHRRFDLHGLRDVLLEEDLADIVGGPLNWLSLHFLQGRKK